MEITKCLGCGKFEWPDGTWRKENPEPDNPDTWYDSGWCPECLKKEQERIKRKFEDRERNKQ